MWAGVLVRIALIGLLAIAGGAAAAEYWAFDLPLGPMPAAQHSGIMLSNEAPVPGTATVYDTTGPVATYTIPPGGTVTHLMADRPTDSIRTMLGVYEVQTSSSDIVATVISPTTPQNNNDASRLLRYEELGLDHYIWAPNQHTGSPLFPHTAFMMAIATDDNTRVTFTPTAATNAAGDGSVAGLPPGVPTTFVMSRGEVINLHAPAVLTGSRIQADKPIAVFSGHECTNLDTSACDLLAEQIASVDYAGTEFIGCSTVDLRGDGAETVDRYWVIATGPTTVTVQPPGVSYPMAGAGSVLEFDSREHVRITSTAPVLVAMANAGDRDTGDAPADHPSMVQLLPRSRYTANHILPMPSGWTFGHHVMVAAPAGTSYTLGGMAPLPPFAWEPVVGTTFRCGIQTVPLAGTYTLAATDRVGVTVFAPMPNTSYWYRTDGECVDWAVLPTAPTSLTATSLAAPLDVQLDWGAVLDDGGCPVQRYHVYRSTTMGGPGARVSTEPRTDLTYTDTVPASCRTYYYSVTAETRAGEGPRSNVVSHFHAGMPNAPDPVRLDVDLASNTVFLDWVFQDDGGCPVTEVRVYRDGALQALLGPTRTSYTEGLRDRCGPVTYQVSVVTQMGESPRSMSVSYPDGPYPEDCRPRPPAEHAGDADGDGVPDSEDLCPFTNDPGQADADEDGIGDACDADPGLTPALPPEPGPSTPSTPCTRTEPPSAAQAALGPGFVTVTWQFPGDCTTSHFLVFNATYDLLAIVPVHAERVVHDRAPEGTHHYYIQGVQGDDRTFAIGAAIRSNDVFVPCQDCGADASDDPTPSSAEAPARTNWLAWGGLAAFVALSLLLLILFARRDRDGPKGPQGPDP